MELKVIECSQYVLEERINEFAQDHKIKHITYLFKAPNILAVIEHTTNKEYIKKIAQEEKEQEKADKEAETDQYFKINRGDRR